MESANSGYSQWAYIVDRNYAQCPEHYVRAFLLIQSDLLRLFQFVEPSDTNLIAYSYRMHELLMRTCIEIEANFKAILKENIFNPTDRNGDPIPEQRWNIGHYRKVNKTHHLSAYRVHIPIWEGTNSVYQPFKQWATSTDLPWYQAYNKSKHDRRTAFKEANFENLLNSVGGLLVLLSSQFRTEDFTPGSRLRTVSVDSYYSTKAARGNFFT